jgi:hypothetical protein
MSGQTYITLHKLVDLLREQWLKLKDLVSPIE